MGDNKPRHNTTYGHMMKIICNVTDDENSVSFIADPEQITLF
jgi:hypothetical protein